MAGRALYWSVDGVVSVHDLPTLALKEQLIKARGALTFAINPYCKDSLQLAVVARRRLFLFTLQDGALIDTKVDAPGIFPAHICQQYSID